MDQISLNEVSVAIPTFWASIAIGSLKYNTVMTQLVNRDYDNMVASLGDTITITKKGTLEVKQKATYSPVQIQNPTNTKLDVKLDQHDEVTWQIEDIASALALASAIEYVSEAMIAISEKMDNLLLGLHSTVASSVGTPGVNLTADTIVDAREELNRLKCPMAGRYLIISGKDEAALLKTEKFTSASWRDSNQRALTEGYLGRAYGFDIITDQQVNTGGSSPSTTYNLAFVKDAFVLVSRPLPLPPSGYGVSSSIATVDGIAVRVNSSYDTYYLAQRFTIDLLYGFRDLRADTHAVVVKA